MRPFRRIGRNFEFHIQLNGGDMRHNGEAGARDAIDPALGLDLIKARTLTGRNGSVAIMIPAHNEEDAIAQVVRDGLAALEILNVDGDVIVAASGCTDGTKEAAITAGAKVVDTAIGKGSAIRTGLAATDADIICLIDGDSPLRCPNVPSS